MCFGSSMPAPPPPPPPAPPPPFKRAGMVEPATSSRGTSRGITRRRRGTSQLTTRRPTTGGIQSGQSGVSTNQY